MAETGIATAEMLKRVARFKDLKPNRGAYVDSMLPGHERENYRIIGRSVSEDPNEETAITDPHDFHVGAVKAAPGNGPGLHAHLTDEVFIVLSGRWVVYWGDRGEHEVALDLWDTFSVPPGVMRGFRNVSDDKEACILTIVGGRNPGKVTWSPDVLARAASLGVSRDAQGHVRRSVPPRQAEVNQATG